MDLPCEEGHLGNRNWCKDPLRTRKLDQKTGLIEE
jgi:hypothetical protein